MRISRIRTHSIGAQKPNFSRLAHLQVRRLSADPYITKLRAYVAGRQITAEVLELAAPITNIKSFQQAVPGTGPRDMALGRCIFVPRTDCYIIAIVPGGTRPDLAKVKEALACDLELVYADFSSDAERARVLELTGYPMVSLPPIGHRPSFTVIDKGVLARTGFVYCGGGAPNALLKILPLDLVRLTGAIAGEIVATQS